ncbi:MULTISPECIES: stage V sporulation protein SpoVM [unclassified Rummeliibacillus]|nr:MULTISPECIES: stage V sporulation protein SpoVM [unclassified Rummeliibacillus]
MKVYTFQLPKVVSNFARFCLQMVSNDPAGPKKTATRKKKGNEKTPS